MGRRRLSAVNGRPGLKADSLRLWHLVAVGLAFQSLALVVYLNVGFIEQTAGPVAPVVFLLVTLASIPTAISFAVMSNRRPSAGTGFTWLWETTVPPVGVWLGWLLTSAYAMASILQPVMFGLFFNALLRVFGISTSLATAVGGGLLVTALVAWTTYHQIQISARLIGVFLAVEATFVTFLAAFIVVRQGMRGNLSLDPFNPAAATGGLHGIFLAVLFGLLAISGFDVISPIAEETRAPRRLIPLATILITVIPGIFWMLTSYAIVEAVPVRVMVDQFMASGEVTPVYLIADRYIGWLKILVPLTGMTAVLACFGSALLACSRTLYALAREGFAPQVLATLHPRARIPWNAQLLVLSLVAVLPVGLGAWQGSYLAAFGWGGQLLVFFVLLPYIAVNLANIVYHLRWRRDQFNWLINGLVPLLGIAIDGYVIYYAFFRTLLELPFKQGSSIVWVGIAWEVVGICWTAVAWLRRPADRRNQPLATTVT
ncbi:MAG TPA: APC family permease [Actinomycetota bacterium]|nr:APC family permease [Actinomycetota bacterium]